MKTRFFALMTTVLAPHMAEGPGPFPTWWGWFSWPWWWHHFNSVGRITWTVEFQPSEPLELGYTWNYYWR